MDTKQLITGSPKEGFYPIVQDTVTVIELNEAVMNLTSESSSEDIAAAFDTVEGFNELIENVRNSENIVNGILMNNDNAIGKIICTIYTYKNQYACDIEYIYDSKIIRLDITNTDGTLSCVRKETNIDSNLTFDGDGTKFLSDDGTYKTIEVGDKTNVLILSLENDLANGQKGSPVEAEVSTALKDAISTGKACVIKSANSDILANLQQIGDNVTIVMEQISRVGQTFVAVNTTITVNTATNVISDYQTGAIVLETEGDGSKFLSNDGTYKEIPQPNLSNYLAKNNTTEFIPTADYNPATKKYVDDSKTIYFTDLDELNINKEIVLAKIENKEIDTIILTNYNTDSQLAGTNWVFHLVNGAVDNMIVTLNCYRVASENIKYCDIYQLRSGYNNDFSITKLVTVNIASKTIAIDDSISDITLSNINDLITYGIENKLFITTNSNSYGDNLITPLSIEIEDTGSNAITHINGWDILNSKMIHIKHDDNTKEITREEFKMPRYQVITESEYSALGTTPETDDILYFVIPD